MAAQYYEGIGRRKAASARVRIFPGGTGSLTINDKDGTDYLPRPGDVEILLSPLTITGNQKSICDRAMRFSTSLTPQRKTRSRSGENWSDKTTSTARG